MLCSSIASAVICESARLARQSGSAASIAPSQSLSPRSPHARLATIIEQLATITRTDNERRAARDSRQNQVLADGEEAARERVQKLLAAEQARVKKLEEQQAKMSTTLR